MAQNPHNCLELYHLFSEKHLHCIWCGIMRRPLLKKKQPLLYQIYYCHTIHCIFATIRAYCRDHCFFTIWYWFTIIRLKKQKTWSDTVLNKEMYFLSKRCEVVYECFSDIPSLLCLLRKQTKFPSFLCSLTVQHDFQVVEIKTVASLSTLTTFMPQSPKYGVFMELDLFRDNRIKFCCL